MHRSPLVGRIGLVVLLGSCLAAACSHAQTTQPGPCDPSLHSAQGHPYAYRNRGDRCEGVYAKPVSSTSAQRGLDHGRLRRLQHRFRRATLDPLGTAASADRWACEAPVGRQRQAHHATTSICARNRCNRGCTTAWTRYGPPGDATFAWPKDTLGALAISRSALGVLGWTTRLVGGIERPVYLPLRVRRTRRRPRSLQPNIACWSFPEANSRKSM